MKKAPEMRTWEISRIKGTPAAILGRINAPDGKALSMNGLKNSKSPILRRLLLVGGFALTGCTDNDTYTLYRNSPAFSDMRMRPVRILPHSSPVRYRS